MVDATLTAALSSTKNQSGERDPEMNQSKKGNHLYFCTKAHIGVNADSGLVHTAPGTSGNVSDVLNTYILLRGQETDAFGDAGYQGVHKRLDTKPTVRSHVAMLPGFRQGQAESPRVSRRLFGLSAHTTAADCSTIWR